MIFRWLIILALTFLSIIGISPTIDYYSNYFGNDFLSKEELDKSNNLKDKSLTLGLDLQGGMHMVLELDIVDLYKNLINDEYKNSFEELDEFEKKLVEVNQNSTSLNFIDNLFSSYDNENLINYYSDFLPSSIKPDEEVEFLKKILKNKLSTKLLSSTEIIRSRIDALGVTEPLIQTKGVNQIIVELAGIKDTSRAESLIKNTGKLEFIIVKDNSKAWIKLIDKIDQNLNKNQSLAKLIDIDYAMSLAPFIYTNGKIPYLYIENSKKEDINLIINNSKNNKILNNAQFLWGIKNEDIEGHTALYLLNRYVELSGNEIRNPKAETYPIDHQNSGKSYISLEFTNAKDFEEITGDNRGKFLAIILDNEVKMAPRINEKIPTGQAQISGSFTSKEAKDMEAILVAGELPAKINIGSQLQVDASLGKDSINSGFKSIIIAFLTVLVFMLFYYKGFGILANIAMLLNLLFVIAFLSNPWVNATLSLPGIAGMILTVGMAIDANVIIFERIKEEIRKGKKVLDAINFGYEKAFKTILDSNLTTLISATSLYIFGSGPVKGFSITLSLGIICSMFTAIFVTKTILITILNNKNIKKLSI
ncbi:MAG: protein translocase subunit SecD [Candidatus Marinimicrobia bacterium]|nr:protein translocase subunit SecD [Candidatus Neomarinimicrobiota bacterium]